MINRLFPLLLLVGTVLGVCENDWTEYEGLCYKSLGISLAYAKAEERCVRLDAHLASVTDKKQALFLESLVGSGFPLTGLKLQNGKHKHPFSNTPVNIPMCDPPPKAGEECARVFDVNCEPCSQPVNCNVEALFVCQKGGWIPTTTTTTTKKPTTTTTKKPVIADPKKWIIDYTYGAQIHRSYNAPQFIHHYTIDWRTTPAGFTREDGNGFVVSVDRFPQIQATCPDLIKVGIWRYGAMSYIGNQPPGMFQRQEEFYCAPSQFYCGANFLLRRLDKHGGGNIFYASNETEANRQLLGFEPKLYSANWFQETPCWVWQDYTDTWYSIVRANGGMIWGGYHEQAIVHFYTLQRHLIPAGWQKEQAAPPGYVVMQNLYDSYFKTQCPELVPARIWHGYNGMGQTITWIGREGQSPPAAMRNSWQEELRFYCAPRFNYCNANYLLRRMDKTNGAISFYYPWSESNALAQLRGDPPSVFKNSGWSEEVCYIWANWY